MNHADFASLTTADLVQHYAELGVEEDAIFDDSDRINMIRPQMWAIEDELKSRPGDQRRALLPLYDHPKMAVRLHAAKATLAIAPEQARKMIEWIASINWHPQSGDAGMCLWALDKGVFVPK